MKAEKQGNKQRTAPEQRPRKTAEKVWWMGRSYLIPVDEDGYVPIEAMVMRYQEMGNSGRDRARDATIIYPQHATPKEIVGWWADPSSCDIEGIDTRNSKVYDVSGVKGKEMRRVQKRIGIVTPSSAEQRRIREVLARTFTAKELDRMTRNGSFVIRTVKDNGSSYGYYLMRSDGQKVPLITIEEGVSADTIVHETVHHARTTRPPGKTTSCAYPQRKDGSFDSKKYASLSDRQREQIRDAEEAATTAEATMRTHRDRTPSGYWDRVGGRETYLRDRRELAKACGGKDCTLKGVPAVKTVEKKFDRLQLANSILLADTPAKESVREARRINGTQTAKKETSVVKSEVAASGKPRKQTSKSTGTGKGKPKSTGKGGAKR